MIPRVENKKTDGNLGVATDTDRILAIIATSSSGEKNVPTSLAGKNDVRDEFVGGPIVEAGAYAIEKGVPVVLLRAEATTAGAYGVVDETGVLGTATVAAGATEPIGAFDAVVEVLKGGELGVTGIEYRYSLDDGVSWSPTQSLGTSLVLACGAGVSFALSSASDTLEDGDTWSVTTTAPKIQTGDLAQAFDAL